MQTINLAALKKEDIEVVDLNGVSYTIPGNFSTEFSLRIQKTMKDIDKAREEEDVDKVYEILMDWCYQLVSLDRSKKVTRKDVEVGFGDVLALEVLFDAIFKKMIG